MDFPQLGINLKYVLLVYDFGNGVDPVDLKFDGLAGERSCCQPALLPNQYIGDLIFRDIKSGTERIQGGNLKQRIACLNRCSDLPFEVTFYDGTAYRRNDRGLIDQMLQKLALGSCLVGVGLSNLRWAISPSRMAASACLRYPLFSASRAVSCRRSSTVSSNARGVSLALIRSLISTCTSLI